MLVQRWVDNYARDAFIQPLVCYSTAQKRNEVKCQDKTKVNSLDPKARYSYSRVSGGGLMAVPNDADVKSSGASSLQRIISNH